MSKDGYSKEWLTKEEWKKFINQDMDWRDEILFKTLYKGALRVSECLKLQYPMDYELEENQGYVIIREQLKKNDQEKYDPEIQPISKSLIKETRRYFSQKNRDTRYVFSTRQSDQMSRQRVNQLIDSYAENIGINKKLGSHTLRRSRAKHLIDEGMDISAVKNYLRHDKLSTTMRYLKIGKKFLATESEKIDKEYDL